MTYLQIIHVFSPQVVCLFLIPKNMISGHQNILISACRTNGDPPLLFSFNSLPDFSNRNPGSTRLQEDFSSTSLPGYFWILDISLIQFYLHNNVTQQL